MKKTSILLFAFLAITAFGIQNMSAQVTITIPKIPKIKKPKVEVKQTEPTPTTDGQISGQDSTSEQKSGKDDEMDFRLSFFLDEIKKAQKSVDEYDSDTKLYLISSALSDWLWRAVSIQEREKWGKEWLKKPNEKQKFNEALDTLAASAAKQLPNYRMNTKNYAVHNPAEEKMMKTILKNPAIYTIHYVGLEKATWLIDKNDLGIPTSRYKHGAIWLRDTTKDHPYCYITYVNIIQDYAGGGTYAASYPYFVRDEMVGCPAGK
jgi:hypothetical protein